jgi:hypothetical protein
MEVMGLMLGEFVDDYTVRVIDVFAMPQSGTVRGSLYDKHVGCFLASPRAGSGCYPSMSFPLPSPLTGCKCGSSRSCLPGKDAGHAEADRPS